MNDLLRTNYLRGLQAALAKGGERDVQRFLNVTYRPLYLCFANGWNSVAVVSQFPFGREFRSDFLVLSAMSGLITAALVELESPKARLFLKDGTPSQTLRTAQRQVSDWADWIARRPEQFRREITAVLDGLVDAPDDAPFPGYRARLFRQHIAEELVPVRPKFYIVIGRRTDLSDDDQRRRSRRDGASVEIATYDRLLDSARDDAARHKRGPI